MSRTFLVGFIALASVVLTSARADAVRYFLSPEGLSNPNNTDSASVPPTFLVDPALPDGQHRIYIWAQLLTPNSSLKGADLAFRTEGGATITRVNIWQNNFVPAVTTRWNPNGVPGVIDVPGGSDFVDPPPAVSVLEAGVTNGAFAPFDDQWDDGIGAAVIGYLDVMLPNVSTVHIINQGSGFLSTSGNHRVYLGWDDAVGAPAEVPGVPYDNASWEASEDIPEPSSLLLVGCAALMFGRRSR